jgi:hypothetical protein
MLPEVALTLRRNNSFCWVPQAVKPEQQGTAKAGIAVSVEDKSAVADGQDEGRNEQNTDIGG